MAVDPLNKRQGKYTSSSNGEFSTCNVEFDEVLEKTISGQFSSGSILRYNYVEIQRHNKAMRVQQKQLIYNPRTLFDISLGGINGILMTPRQ